MKDNIYIQNGYKSRVHYLQEMATDYGVDFHTVSELAALLGPDEDFDRLLTALEDASDEAPDAELTEEPHTVPFKKGQHLMHPHSKKEVVVERDNGGATVYVAFLGTGRTQSIPRDALIPMEPAKPKKSTKAAADDVPQRVKGDTEVKSKPTTESPFKEETRAFMQEVIPENYAQIMHMVLGERIRFKYDPKNWGRIKMQMSNRVRGLLVRGEITEADLWEKLTTEIGVDRGFS